MAGFDPGDEERAVAAGRFTPPLRIIRRRDIGEDCVQRLGHPLSGAMRYVELGADVFQIDTAPPERRHLRQARRILRFGERHLTSMPEIDTIISY